LAIRLASPAPILCLFLLFFFFSCGPSLKDSVEDLGSTDPATREMARQELILAKDRAIAPLLEALADAQLDASKPLLVEVLGGLSRRVEDQRITKGFYQRLRVEKDAPTRAAIAHQLGALGDTEGIEPLLQASLDPDGTVRHQTMLALGRLEGKMSVEQKKVLQHRAQALAGDAHLGTRMESMIRVEAFVDAWLEEARNLALKAQLAAAESLYHQALDYAPTSQRGNYRLARFYLDNGQLEKGMEMLANHGMLLHAPTFVRPPEIDGYLDEQVWQNAARADSFFIHSSQHFAAIPSKQGAEIRIGYDAEALYIGFRGADAHPDSLVAKTHERDGSLWQEDILELFIDPGFDHRSYIHLGINSLGVFTDAALDRQHEVGGIVWNSDARIEAQIGKDHWSLELAIPFGTKEFPRPQPKDQWGINFVRVFRGAEYSQWVRTYSGGHSPDDFGLLIFQ